MLPSDVVWGAVGGPGQATVSEREGGEGGGGSNALGLGLIISSGSKMPSDVVWGQSVDQAGLARQR